MFSPRLFVYLNPIADGLSGLKQEHRRSTSETSTKRILAIGSTSYLVLMLEPSASTKKANPGCSSLSLWYAYLFEVR